MAEEAWGDYVKKGPASTDTRGKASADAARDRRNDVEDSTASCQQSRTQIEKPGYEPDRGRARVPCLMETTASRFASRRRPLAHPDVEPPHLSLPPQ
jgi:hypothetical protein